MHNPTRRELTSLLRDAAQTELLPRFRRSTQRVKADGSLVTEADVAMQTCLQTAMAKLTPGIPLVGEETPEHEADAVMTATNAQFWCLDPLDGTTNFACGVPFFAVSLALIEARRVELGVIYDPVRDECFFAQRGSGAWLNDARLSTTAQSTVPLRQGVGIVDLKRLPPTLATRLATAPPYASQRSFGSVALDWCWIAAGRGHVYVHGKQKVWDYAAGTLILEEAGGRSATLDGAAVFDGSFGARSAVAALDAATFDAWCAWLHTAQRDAAAP